MIRQETLLLKTLIFKVKIKSLLSISLPDTEKNPSTTTIQVLEKILKIITTKQKN